MKNTFKRTASNASVWHMAARIAGFIPTVGNSITLDANDVTAYFARELEHVDTEIQRTKFAPLKAAEFLEITSGGGPNVNQETYRKVTEIGRAEWISNASTEVVYSDVVGSEYTRDVRSLASGYRYSVIELQNAAASPTIRLDTERKESAVNMVRRRIDDALLIGESTLGWTGLFNDANVPLVTAITGAWTTTATGHQIAADFGKLVRSLFKATKEHYEASVVGIPTAMIDAFDKPLTTTSDITVREYVEKTFKVKIVTSHHLDTAGAGGIFRVVAMAKGKDVVRGIVNQPFQELAPQHLGLDIRVPCFARAAGVQVRQPLAVAYMDLAA
jgi:hypothetical protein